MGLEGELGFAFPQDVSVMAAAAHLPIKVTMGKNINLKSTTIPPMMPERYRGSQRAARAPAAGVAHHRHR